MNALAQTSGLDVEIISAKAVGGMPPVVEDTGTFVGNARKKALALKAILPADAWVLSDDSGLCVDALGGGPGVESAYYAGPQGDGADNLRKLVEAMKGVLKESRGAHFTCVLVLIGTNGDESVVEGYCAGYLLGAPQGGDGFGYDPLFALKGSSLSFAQLGNQLKGQVSHRANAWVKLIEIIKTKGRLLSAR